MLLWCKVHSYSRIRDHHNKKIIKKNTDTKHRNKTQKLYRDWLDRHVAHCGYKTSHACSLYIHIKEVYSLSWHCIIICIPRLRLYEWRFPKQYNYSGTYLPAYLHTYISTHSKTIHHRSNVACVLNVLSHFFFFLFSCDNKTTAPNTSFSKPCAWQQCVQVCARDLIYHSKDEEIWYGGYDSYNDHHYLPCPRLLPLPALVPV